MRPDLPVVSIRVDNAFVSIRDVASFVSGREVAQNICRAVFRTSGHIVFGLGFSFAVTAK
jgi:hypothetical protein